MCASHWRLVPRRLHAPIYNGYRDFCAGLALPESYRDAVREAIAIASRADPPPPAQLELLATTAGQRPFRPTAPGRRTFRVRLTSENCIVSPDPTAN
jgi:hypothetical protein